MFPTFFHELLHFLRGPPGPPGRRRGGVPGAAAGAALRAERDAGVAGGDAGGGRVDNWLVL